MDNNRAERQKIYKDCRDELLKFKAKSQEKLTAKDISDHEEKLQEFINALDKLESA